MYNANSAHPFENPNGVTNLLQIVLILMIPFALTFRTLAKNRRQGWVVFAAMFVLRAGSAVLAMTFETGGNTLLDGGGVAQEATAAQSGGNLEGKEVRIGAAASGLYAASTTGTSTGAVNSSHDSFTPGGGAVPLVT